MRKKELVFITVALLSLSVSGCRENELKENSGRENISTAQVENEEAFGLSELKVSGTEQGSDTATRGSYLIPYKDEYLYVAGVFQTEQTNGTAYNLVHLDSEQNKWVVMCNNPACSHTSAECISYMRENERMGMCGDGENIYFLKTEIQKGTLEEEKLYKIDMDTFEQEKLTTLFTFANGSSYRDTWPMIYDGYYYSAKDLYDSDTGELNRMLYRCKLEKGAVPEKIYCVKNKETEGIVADIEAEGEYVFYVLAYMDHSQVVSLNIKTGQVSEKELNSWSISLKNGHIYSVVNHELCEYTNTFEEIRKISTIGEEIVTRVVAGQEYLLLYITETDRKKICLYSYEGEKKGEFIIEGSEWGFLDCNDDTAYFTKKYTTGKKETENERIAQVKIKEIISGQAVLEEFVG